MGTQYAVVPFDMGNVRPYILHIIFGLTRKKHSSRSVHPLRLENPAQLGLQSKEGVEQGWCEYSSGGHSVFRNCNRLPIIYLGADGVPMDELG